MGSRKEVLHIRKNNILQFRFLLTEKKFFSKNTLAIHRKYHFNDKKFSCGYCDKKFTQSGDLKTHQRIHTGSKPYKCTLCDKAFRSSGNRKDHMSVHEEEKRFVVRMMTNLKRKNI